MNVDGPHILSRRGLLTLVSLAVLVSLNPEGADAQEPEIVPASSESILLDVMSGRSDLTVVNMWATWCAPCIEEFPDFVATSRKYDSEVVRILFVSVDFDDDLADVRRFLSENKWFASSYLKDEKDDEFVRRFGSDWTGAVPATFVYDRRGSLIWFREGKTNANVLESVFRNYLSDAQQE
ncbi:MAG: TlpA family protein disulfide reductase [Rhodothermales bacterium]|nr:TlpA family protein disulfide reductase [Rhodothermales bacterium]